MTKRKWFREQVEPGGGLKQKLKTKLAGLTLLATLLLGKPWYWVAQEVKTQDRKDYWKELVMKENSANKEATDTISRYDATWWEWVWIEKDPVDWEKTDWDDWETWWVEEEKQSDKKWWVKVHWMLYGWTWVAWDYAEVCSDRWTLVSVVDVSHSQTWLWFTAIRLDDFHNDPDQPASRATVLNPHWNKQFWRLWIGVEWKYTFIDNLPQANWFSPDVVLSYTADGWRTFEWMYAHKFKTWEDSDAFRLTVSKKINEVLKLTWQWWYETWYDKKFYGRIIVDVDLWNWFWAQLSCIAKYWKLTPTAWIVYKF